MTTIIGFGHYSRTGKDTTANALLSYLNAFQPDCRVQKRSFAWKLKQITYELYEWAGMMPPEHYETKDGEKDRDIVLPDLGMTPVEVWVRFGTHAVREQVYQDTWLNYLVRGQRDLDVLLIPDVRFPNEANAIKAAGGKVVKVVRPGYGPRKTAADRALLDYHDWDYIIGGSGDIEELDQWAECLALAALGDEEWPHQCIGARQLALSVEVIEPWKEAA